MSRHFLQVVCALVLSICGFAHADGRDGAWLIKGIDAYERTEAKISAPTSSDTVDATIVMAYVNGFLSVHELNRTIYRMLEKAARATPPTLTAKELRIALAFAPLRNLPDGLSMHQTLAIVKRYLASNPQKWHEPAHLLLHAALSEAFPPLPAGGSEGR